MINSAIVVRTPGDIFAQWEREHGVGGDALAEQVWAHQDRIEEELFVETARPGRLGRSSELAAQAAEKLGIEGHLMRRSVKDCLGSAGCLQGCRHGKKQSTNLQWVPEVLERGGALLSLRARQAVSDRARTSGRGRGRFRHPQHTSEGRSV